MCGKNFNFTFKHNLMKTPTNIDEVLQRLDDIIAWSKVTKNPAGYFASTYKCMTAAVAHGIKKNKFEDGPRMERLDVAFASRYLEAFENYRHGRKCTNAWFTAFEAAKNKDLLIMQHILLGINAHINLDLGVSAASVMPYRRITPLKNDFNTINNVIAAISQNVQDSLNKICYPVSIIDELSNGQDNVMLDFAISKARDTSWASAFILSNSIQIIRPSLIRMIDNAATLVARNIIVSEKTPENILKKLKSCESSDVHKNIEILSATIV